MGINGSGRRAFEKRKKMLNDEICDNRTRQSRVIVGRLRALRGEDHTDARIRAEAMPWFPHTRCSHDLNQPPPLVRGYWVFYA